MNRKQQRQSQDKLIREYQKRRLLHDSLEDVMTTPGNIQMPSSPTDSRQPNVSCDVTAGQAPATTDPLGASPKGDDSLWPREQLWHAVVNAARRRSCWLHRTSGQITTRANLAKQFPDSFVQIEAFTKEADCEFTNDFLRKHGLKNRKDLEKAANSEEPWREIPKALFKIERGDLRNKFKHERGRYIVEQHIEVWRHREELDQRMVYEPPGVESLHSKLPPEEIRKLDAEIDLATQHGQRAVVAYAFGLSDPSIHVLVADLPLLPVAFRMIDAAYIESRAGRTTDRYHLGFHFNEPAALRSLAQRMSESLSVERISLVKRTRKLVKQAIRRAGASHYLNKAFGLIDICGFSSMAPAQQLQALLALNLGIKQAGVRMKCLCGHLKVNHARFARVSTGDGCYIWHQNTGDSANTAVFVYLLATIAQIQLLRALGKTDIRIRAAFTIGEVYTFCELPLGTGSPYAPDAIHQNAVGPATNELARLIDGCRPGQFVLGDFQLPGRRGSNPMTAKTLVSEVRAALLPLELTESDKAWFQSTELVVDPSDRPLLVTDKHGDGYRAWNVHGNVQAWAVDSSIVEPAMEATGNGASAITEQGRFSVSFLRVGLEPDTARSIDDMIFKNIPAQKLPAR